MMNGQKKSSSLAVICLVGVFTVALGIVVFSYVHFARDAMPVNPSEYLSQLTLVVTIVAVVAALFSLVGVFMTHRTVQQASDIREQTLVMDKELKVRKEEVESKLGEAETLRIQADSLLASLKNCAAAFHPSGLFLAGKFREVADALCDVTSESETESGQSETDMRGEHECISLLEKLVTGLAKGVEANAEYGAQVQRLFTGSEIEVEGSALFLVACADKTSASRLIRQRIDHEKAKPDGHRSSNLISTLAFQLGRLANGDA